MRLGPSADELLTTIRAVRRPLDPIVHVDGW